MVSKGKHHPAGLALKKALHVCPGKGSVWERWPLNAVCPGSNYKTAGMNKNAPWTKSGVAGR